MEVKQYYDLMWKKVVELEENMSNQERHNSLILCNKLSLELVQHPMEFYFCINQFDYKQSVIKKLLPKQEDVILDVGTGVGDLPLMIKDKVSKVYALELHKDIYNLAKPYINGNIEFYNIPFQKWQFPKDITKAVFLAWHCSELTLLNLIERLEKTNCKILIHNFGKANSIQVKIINKQEVSSHSSHS